MNLAIWIVELGPNSYFWTLTNDKEMLAHSNNIGNYDTINKEVFEINKVLKLPVYVSERQKG